MNVTYSDLIQILIFIVALVGVGHEIFKASNSRQLLRIVDGCV